MKSLLVSAALVACFLPAAGNANPYDGMAKLDVRPGWRTSNGENIAALEITLAEGWKTYWRAPGDAGIPPVINWTGSRNVKAVAINWPTPVVFSQNGMRSVGYKSKLILPLNVIATDSTQKLTLAGSVQIGICNEVCVPVQIDFEKELPIAKTAIDPKIAAALANRPATQSEADVSAVSCLVSPIETGMTITASIEVKNTGSPEFVVFETGDPQIWADEAITERHGSTLVARTTLEHSSGKSFALDRSKLRITILGQHSAIDIKGCQGG